MNRVWGWSTEEIATFIEWCEDNMEKIDESPAKYWGTFPVERKMYVTALKYQKQIELWNYTSWYVGGAQLNKEVAWSYLFDLANHIMDRHGHELGMKALKSLKL